MDGHICADHGALHRALLFELRHESGRLDADYAFGGHDPCELLACVALVSMDEERAAGA